MNINLLLTLLIFDINSVYSYKNINNLFLCHNCGNITLIPQTRYIHSLFRIFDIVFSCSFVDIIYFNNIIFIFNVIFLVYPNLLTKSLMWLYFNFAKSINSISPYTRCSPPQI